MKTSVAESAIPLTEWGRDHWGIFLYIEERCVNGRDGIGIPDLRRVQTNFNRHPGLSSRSDGSAYGIRLKDRVLPGPDYDEWDCLDDCEHAGLIEGVGTGIRPAYRMTDKGLRYAARLRAYKALGGTLADFARR